MNYEEKYNKALEKAKTLYNSPFVNNDVLEQLFPELKESEDERIRKAIHIYLDWLDGRKGCEPKGKYTIKDMIAWLKEQDNADKTFYEIAEKEKYDFVNGQFIECRKSFDEFKEGTSYWFEYVGDDTYIGRSDNILNKKFHITPKQLYSLFTQQHCPKEDTANEETNAPTEYGKYVDDCLNEAAKHYFSEGEDKYSVADLFYAGVRCGKSWCERQSTADKTYCETTEKAKKWTEADDNNVIILKTICEEAKDGAEKGSLRDIAMDELKQWTENLKRRFGKILKYENN